MQEKIQKWFSRKELEKKEAESYYKKQLLVKAGLIEKNYLKKWEYGAKYDPVKHLYYIEKDVDLDSISDDDYKKIEEYLKTNKTVEENENVEKPGGIAFFLIGLFLALIGFAMVFNGIFLPDNTYLIYGAISAFCSIQFFAMQKIINLLIDIYNKMK